MDYPVYKIGVTEDDSTGIDFVALVAHPAIERNFLAFTEHPAAFKFIASNIDKHIISGPLMVPDMPIFRDQPPYGKHYVVFDQDSVKNICLKFFRQGKTSAVNLAHDDKATPAGIYMFESFLIDKSKGIGTPAGFEALPDGSWFGSYKVDNAAVWEEFIKTGEFKGFSVEGFFDYKKSFESQLEEIFVPITENVH